MSEPVSLREYLEQQFDHLEQTFRVEREAHAEIHRVAKAEVDRRLEGMNELREQITGERGAYVTLAMLDARLSALAADLSKVSESNSVRISLLEQQVANWQGRMIATSAIVAVLIAIAALAIRFL